MAIMATPHCQALLTKTRPAISCCLGLLFFITLATVTKPAFVKAHSSPPSTLVLYVHEDRISPNRTDTIVVSPSGNYNGSVVEFGTIAVISNPVREGAALDSPLLGEADGQITVTKYGTLYLSFAYVLSTPSYAGSITVQGTVDPLGNGEAAITGGTGDFRFARGYIEIRLITDEDETKVVLITTLYIKYDH